MVINKKRGRGRRISRNYVATGVVVGPSLISSTAYFRRAEGSSPWHNDENKTNNTRLVVPCLPSRNFTVRSRVRASEKKETGVFVCASRVPWWESRWENVPEISSTFRRSILGFCPFWPKRRNRRRRSCHRTIVRDTVNTMMPAAVGLTAGNEQKRPVERKCALDAGCRDNFSNIQHCDAARLYKRAGRLGSAHS